MHRAVDSQKDRWQSKIMESAVAAACSRVLCPFVVNLKAASSHATLMVTWDIPCTLCTSSGFAQQVSLCKAWGEETYHFSFHDISWHRCIFGILHGSLNVPIEHHPTMEGIWSIMATIRWCPIYPKWDSYQPLSFDASLASPGFL